MKTNFALLTMLLVGLASTTEVHAIKYQGNIILTICNIEGGYSWPSSPEFPNPDPLWDGSYGGLRVGDSVVGTYSYVSDTVDCEFSHEEDYYQQFEFDIPFPRGPFGLFGLPSTYFHFEVDGGSVSDFLYYLECGGFGPFPIMPDNKLIDYSSFGACYEYLVEDENQYPYNYWFNVYASGSVRYTTPKPVPDSGTAVILLGISFISFLSYFGKSVLEQKVQSRVGN